MITKYFKKADLLNHIYSLHLIFMLTVENKIASKASKLDHVLQIILKRKYNEEPNVSRLPYLRIRDGKKPISTDSTVSVQRRDIGRQRN